ncbi:MAG: hypothetical protein IIZ67_04180 [Bacilli bacterium]|nr:hypothetical protein [Bacilli bacterium]
MIKDDKNKIIILILLIVVLLLLTINGRVEKNSVNNCINSGNTKEFCERGLLR